MFASFLAAALAEQAMKTEQLETVIVSAKAAQEHAEQELRQTQSELQSVQAELAGLKEEAETEKVRIARQLQFASQWVAAQQ